MSTYHRNEECSCRACLLTDPIMNYMFVPVLIPSIPVVQKSSTSSEAANNSSKGSRDKDSAGDGKFYSLKRLQRSPFPAGVNPNTREIYLDDSDFKSIFKMTKMEFANLPRWKQVRAKKDNELF
jgi:hypothetical protein